MGYILKIAFLGLFSSISYLLTLDQIFSWNITVPISIDKTEKANKLFESFKFFDYHPFNLGYELVSENTDEQVYDIKEEIKLIGIFSHTMKSRGVFKKISPSHYKFELKLKFFVSFNVNFIAEYKIKITEDYKSEIIENVEVSGPFVFSFLTRLFGYQPHVTMMNSIKNEI